jgi:hypothetical protein
MQTNAAAGETTGPAETTDNESKIQEPKIQAATGS